MPTSRAVATDLENLLDYLVSNGLALYRTPLSYSPDFLTWQGLNTFTTARGEATTLREYLDWVKGFHFNAILLDGALMQISYNFDGGTVVGHRLAYVPPPFLLDPVALSTEPLADLVEYAALDDGADNIQLRAAIRFDFDPTAVAPGHPAVHLTMNSSDCRIACHSPLRMGSFVRFLFENFYSREWKQHPFLHRLPTGSWGSRLLTAAEEVHPHISWVV